MSKSKAKQPSLFSFFSKKDVLSPKTSNTSPKSASKAAVSTPKQEEEELPKWEVLDVVMTKLEGFPWWPAIVCNHPTLNSHTKREKKHQMIHVQFFDDPISRGWIKLKYVKPYEGSEHRDFQRGGPYYSAAADYLTGLEEADKAWGMKKQDRGEVLTELQPSEDEEEEDDEAVAQSVLKDLDPDIFDAEMSEEEQNNSKENHEDEVEKKPKTTPKKTPKKSSSEGTRSSKRPQAKRRRIVEDSGDDEPEDSEDEFKPKGDQESSESDDSSGVDEEESEPETESEDGSPVKKRRKGGKKEEPAVGVKRKRPGSQGGSSSRTPRIQRTFEQDMVTKFASPAQRADSDDESSKDSTDKPKPQETSKEESTPKPKPQSAFSKLTPSVSSKTKSKLAAFSAPDTPSGPAASEGESRSFEHLTFEFLFKENIRDADKRRPDHPEYNPRTLHVPDSFLGRQTPGMRQWWEIKRHHFDKILFFKMGKFYELFHMDAMTAVNELGIIYMKGDHAHAGFPEIGFSRYSESLIQKGYKVVRIEQTETPDMMNERVKKMSRATKFDKVVKREVCRVTTKGTKIYSFIDGDCSDADHAYLLAFCEKEQGEGKGSLYGVCFVDTSIGKFHIGQFEDDRHCSRLRTLISHYPPAHVLIERFKISEKTQTIVNNNLTTVIKDYIRSGTEFWESGKTLKMLTEGDYFINEENKDAGPQIPETLKKMISQSDSLGQTAADEYELAVRALGAVTWHLQDSCLDQEILSLKSFEEYLPMDAAATDKADGDDVPSFVSKSQKMVLDGVTLFNLDVLTNSSTGTTEGTLLETMDACCTPFGKRLFKQWLCAPLCNPKGINDRLDAVEDLNAAQDVVAEAKELLKKLPDLQRVLSRFHTLGSASRIKNHPDGRAIFFEDVKYNKRKIEDFLTALNGFKTGMGVIQKFKSIAEHFRSQLLKQTVMFESDDGLGRFPDLTEQLEFFNNAFDQEKAKKDGVIKPSKGVDQEYDDAVDDIKNTKRELDDYLEQQKKRLGCRTLSYWGTAKNRFQIEVPDSKKVPDEYQITSSKKGTKRYWTDDIQEMLKSTMDAEDRRDAALKDIMRRIFYTFDKHCKKWESAVQCLSVLDVLMSLAEFSKCGDGEMCRPQFVVPNKDNKPYIEIREGRHPCISKTFSGGDFIPNDTVVGIKDENDMDDDSGEDHSQSNLVLVTGPNMGGKSTLMRQVGVIAIIAQLGCYVPAEKCSLTPVDRVFTRLGASDNIMAGESTFFVELSETSAILQHATKHSLVLLDELGRGTATYDGTAIACGVVQELSQNIGCRTLFSTHYHSLVEEFSHDPNIRLGHMACMVENENEEDPSQETITFLYKFVKGACPKSYGFNAARLADLPEEVIQVAVKKAKEFEVKLQNMRLFRDIEKCKDSLQLKELQKSICAF